MVNDADCLYNLLHTSLVSASIVVSGKNDDKKILERIHRLVSLPLSHSLDYAVNDLVIENKNEELDGFIYLYKKT
jgi:hypothetical protein